MADNEKVAKSEPVKVPATDDRIKAEFKPLVESGAIDATEDEVKVEVKGQEKPASRSYTRLTAVTIEGALALVGGRMNRVAEGDNKGNGVLDYFNYGFDLGVRSNERNALLRSLKVRRRASSVPSRVSWRLGSPSPLHGRW
jgi:hypothetical protein